MRFVHALYHTWLCSVDTAYWVQEALALLSLHATAGARLSKIRVIATACFAGLVTLSEAEALSICVL